MSKYWTQEDLEGLGWEVAESEDHDFQVMLRGEMKAAGFPTSASAWRWAADEAARNCHPEQNAKRQPQRYISYDESGQEVIRDARVVRHRIRRFVELDRLNPGPLPWESGGYGGSHLEFIIQVLWTEVRELKQAERERFHGTQSPSESPERTLARLGNMVRDLSAIARDLGDDLEIPRPARERVLITEKYLAEPDLLPAWARRAIDGVEDEAIYLTGCAAGIGALIERRDRGKVAVRKPKGVPPVLDGVADGEMGRRGA